MNKVLTLDVCVSIAGHETVFDGLTPQEAFNLLMMPSFSSHITALIPNWKDTPADGVSPVSESAS